MDSRAAQTSFGVTKDPERTQAVYDFDVSRTTIEKVLRAMDVKPLSRPRRLRRGGMRYARVIPGERVQMETCKIVPAVYQYTAIDDCTRIRVLAVYPPNGRYTEFQRV